MTSMPVSRYANESPTLATNSSHPTITASVAVAPDSKWRDLNSASAASNPFTSAIGRRCTRVSCASQRDLSAADVCAVTSSDTSTASGLAAMSSNAARTLFRRLFEQKEAAALPPCPSKTPKAAKGAAVPGREISRDHVAPCPYWHIKTRRWHRTGLNGESSAWQVRWKGSGVQSRQLNARKSQLQAYITSGASPRQGWLLQKSIFPFVDSFPQVIPYKKSLESFVASSHSFTRSATSISGRHRSSAGEPGAIPCFRSNRCAMLLCTSIEGQDQQTPSDQNAAAFVTYVATVRRAKQSKPYGKFLGAESARPSKYRRSRWISHVSRGRWAWPSEGRHRCNSSRG